MLTILYCKKCHEKIMRLGGIAFEVFDEVCHSFYSGIPLEIPSDVHDMAHGILQIVEYLEMKGLVVTTDIEDDIIIVKPLGFSDYLEQDSVTHFFCIKGCDSID